MSHAEYGIILDSHSLRVTLATNTPWYGYSSGSLLWSCQSRLSICIILQLTSRIIIKTYYKSPKLPLVLFYYSVDGRSLSSGPSLYRFEVTGFVCRSRSPRKMLDLSCASFSSCSVCLLVFRHLRRSIWWFTNLVVDQNLRSKAGQGLRPADHHFEQALAPSSLIQLRMKRL
jgi:hypothetical protein